MTTDESVLTDSTTQEAAHAAAIAQEASSNALKAQFRELLAESDARTARMIGSAIQEAFGENKAQGRYIDVSRIPLICQNIDGIHKSQTEMKNMVADIRAQQEINTEKMDKRFVSIERFSPVEKIVYGAVGAILLAVLAALLSFVVIKKTDAATLKPISKSTVELLTNVI